jgi:hypothetical protein
MLAASVLIASQATTGKVEQRRHGCSTNSRLVRAM